MDNFPLLVRLSTGQHPDFNLNTFADSESASYEDFRLNGEELLFEVDEWNTSTGESTLWFKYPVLALILKSQPTGEMKTMSLHRTTGKMDPPGLTMMSLAFFDYSDATSNSRNAIATGSPETNATGISGSSILLDGINDRLTITGYEEEPAIHSLS